VALVKAWAYSRFTSIDVRWKNSYAWTLMAIAFLQVEPLWLFIFTLFITTLNLTLVLVRHFTAHSAVHPSRALSRPCCCTCRQFPA
jgi:hypothetical protein